MPSPAVEPILDMIVQKSHFLSSLSQCPLVIIVETLFWGFCLCHICYGTFKTGEISQECCGAFAFTCFAITVPLKHSIAHKRMGEAVVMCVCVCV